VEKADQLEKELVKMTAGPGSRTSVSAGWKEVQKSLKSGEAAIEFMEFNYFDGFRPTDSICYAALILKKGMTEPKLIYLFGKSQLEKELAVTSSGSTGINTFYSRGFKVDMKAGLSNHVYQLVWKNLEEELESVQKVYFAPAGLLHRISWSALPVDSNTVLSDKYQPVQLSSTQMVADPGKVVIKPKDRILLFGGIRYSADSLLPGYAETGKLSSRNGFNYLPGTALRLKASQKTGNRKTFFLRLSRDGMLPRGE
jgi:hypothetical protein